jgi:hypothetical protein
MAGACKRKIMCNKGEAKSDFWHVMFSDTYTCALSKWKNHLFIFIFHSLFVYAVALHNKWKKSYQRMHNNSEDFYFCLHPLSRSLPLSLSIVLLIKKLFPYIHFFFIFINILLIKDKISSTCMKIIVCVCK